MRISQNNQIKFLFIIIILLLSFPHLVSSLTLYKPSFSTLIKEAELIVYAQVSENKLISLKNRIPLLKTTFHVIKTWKGIHQNMVSIQLLASHNDKFKLHLPLPRFEVNHSVFLFLRHSKHSRYPILVALYCGVFDILRSSKGYYVKSRGNLLPKQSFKQFQQTLIKNLSKKNQSIKRQSTTKISLKSETTTSNEEKK